MTDLAPLAFFAFRRPWTTLQSLYALSRCPEAKNTELIIYCDAARRASEESDASLVREIAKSRSWCGRTRVVERTKNLGLAQSIIGGVRDLCESHGRVVVLEDDLLVSRGFLSYMNESLDRYRDDDRVAQVSGHQFPIGLPGGYCGFLPAVTSWGWGTWKRAWAAFEEKPDVSPLRNAALRWAFDQRGSYPYSAMLLNQMGGRADSWAIRWNWTVFRSQKIVLHPSRTLVRNIGFGDVATHTRRRVFATPPDGWDPNARAPAMPNRDQVAINQAWLESWRAAVAGSMAKRIFRQTRSLVPVFRGLLGDGPLGSRRST